MVQTSILPGGSRALRQARQPTGGTRTAARRCCTSSIRCGSNMSATRSTSIGRRTSAAGRPLEGKTALDVGCGAGLLTEPLARLGRDRSPGIDASPEVDRGRTRACRGDGPRDRLSRWRRPGARGPVRPDHGDGGDRACRRPRGVREGACEAAGARRAADDVDAQRDRLVEAHDDHHRAKASARSRRARTISTNSSRPTG